MTEDPAGLSPRAARFLREAAERMPLDSPDGPAPEELQALVGRWRGADLAHALTTFRSARSRYTGLRYRSIAWSFEETITFDPRPWTAEDYGPDDRDVLADLLVPAAARSFSAWLRGDGAVVYCFPGPGSPPVVPVFPAIDALLEAEALYRECASWTPVALDDAPSLAAVEAHAQSLPLISEARGYTEH